VEETECRPWAPEAETTPSSSPPSRTGSALHGFPSPLHRVALPYHPLAIDTTVSLCFPRFALRPVFSVSTAGVSATARPAEKGAKSPLFRRIHKHAPMRTRTSPFGVAPSRQSLGTRPQAPHAERARHGQSTAMARRSPARRSGRGRQGDAVGFALVRGVYRVGSRRRGRSEGHDATSPRRSRHAQGAAVTRPF